MVARNNFALSIEHSKCSAVNVARSHVRRQVPENPFKAIRIKIKCAGKEKEKSLQHRVVLGDCRQTSQKFFLSVGRLRKILRFEAPLFKKEHKKCHRQEVSPA